MFIEIVQPSSFNWILVLVTFMTSLVSAGLGTWISYIFLTYKDKKNAKSNNEIALTLIREKAMIMKRNIDGLYNYLNENNLNELNNINKKELLSKSIKTCNKIDIQFQILAKDYEKLFIYEY